MNIIVLCGGLSSERDVSISSGTQVAKALREKGHKAVLVDLFFGYTGAYTDPKEVFDRPADETAFAVKEQAPDLEAIRCSRRQADDCLLGGNVIELCRAADIVFLALHGDVGENGKLQATFDIHGIRYTGSGYLGSAAAMNKAMSKRLFRAENIPTPDGITVYRGETPYASIGFPCVVKPCSGGSSVGTSIVTDEKDYLPALETAFRYENAVIVEQYVRARELTVGVLDGKAMPVIEIIPKTGFYDYKNKYQAGLTVELCPAPITPAQTAEAQALAVKVMETLMVEVYGRVDMLFDEQSGVMYCLEANTLPGMTPTSLVPQMGQAMGLSFPDVCEAILRASLRKYEA